MAATPLSSPFFSLVKWWTFLQFLLVAIIALIGLSFNRIQNYFQKRNRRIQDRIHRELSSAISANKIPPTRYSVSQLIPVISELNTQITDPFWEEIRLHLFMKVLFPRARRLSSSMRWTKRMLAMRCFLLFIDPSNEEYILRLLKDSTPMIKYTAAYAAARLGSAKSTQAIIEEMDRSDHFLRHPFLDAIFKGHSSIFGHVEDILEHAENDYTKVSCFEILAHHMNERVVGLAQKNLQASHMNLRIAATRALGHFPNKTSQDLLIALLKDPQWEVRAIAASALGNIHAQQAISQLELLLKDKTWWVRMNAAIALKKMGMVGEKILAEQDPQKDRYAYEIAQYVLPLVVR